jgi:hypothetical protein
MRTTRRGVAVAAAVIAVALAAAFYVHGLRTRTGTFHTEGPPESIGNLFVADTHRPGWATPAALVIAISGITAAAVVLRRTR